MMNIVQHQVFGSKYGCSLNMDGVIAYYPLIDDAKECVNNLNGEDTFVDYDALLGAEFTAANASGILVGNSDLFTFSDGNNDTAFSVSFSILFKNSQNSWILSKRSGNTYNVEWQIYKYGINNLSIAFYDTTNVDYIGRRLNVELNYGISYNITITYDGSGLASGINLYLDDFLENGSIFYSGSYVCMKNTSSKLVFGNPEWTSLFNFNGYLKNVCFFNKIISSEDIFYLASL